MTRKEGYDQEGYDQLVMSRNSSRIKASRKTQGWLLLSYKNPDFFSGLSEPYSSPSHNQNWIYDFLSSDWLTQNQNIAQTAKELRPREMAAMSRRKPLQRYS